MHKQLWLINYRSGNWEVGRLAEAMRSRVSVRAIDFPRLQEQVQDAAAFDRVIVVGGDGTCATILGEASDELSPLQRAPIGLLPIGTANDLAREVGSYDLCRGVSCDELPQVFESLSERRLAIWELSADDARYGFCNYASLGFEGAVVRDFHTWRTRSKLQNRLLNRAMYTYFGIHHMFSFLPETHLDTGDTRVACARTRGIILSNIKSHMGIGTLSRESDPFDDVIECIRASSPLAYLHMILAKTGVLPAMRAFHRGRDFALEGLPPGTPLQIDGEAKPAVRQGKVAVRLRGFARVLSGI